MKQQLFTLLLCMWATHSLAQPSNVSGTVRDTLENKNLQHAVVAILRSSDSVLVKFTRTSSKGEFRLNDIAPGNYVLLISYPKFADYAEHVEITHEGPLQLGVVALTPAAKLMEAVIVRTNNTMRIRGDTTEFTADSFKVRDGATVEELLKQLPGFTVNSKGEITAQGKRVDRVLVDGEEFFGEDPTIATQNIGARAVDKVQIFDTKSEQDQLKGIGASGDGGKTINIKLKDSAKRGYFGKVEAGSDFNKYHNAKLMLNRFQGSQKISIYGTKSTTNTGSLGWDDQNKLGLEDDDYEFDEVSGFYYSYGGEDEFASWNLRGLPNAYTAGALYSNKWQEDKHKLNVNYLYNRLGTTNRSSNISQIQARDTTFDNRDYSNTKGWSQRHSIKGKYEWKIDSLASIKFKITGSDREKNQFVESYGDSRRSNAVENLELVNENERTNELYSRQRQLDNVITYKQLFKKKNRQLLTTLRMNLVEDDGHNYLNSRTDLYNNGTLISSSIIDQQKENDGNSRTLGVKVTYNEPITDKWNLVTEYSLNQNVSESHRNSYNKDSEGKYSVLDPEFSNNFDLNALSNSGTVTARYLAKKFRFAGGAGISAVRLNLEDLDQDKKTRYNFLGFTPRAQFAYIRSQQSQVSINYTGNTVQPTLMQLQPLRNNEDPRNIYIGNPDLKVGFNHSINLHLNDYRVLSGRSIFGNVGITFRENAITQKSTLDKEGIRTYRPVNVDGNYNYYSWLAWNSGQGDNKLIHGMTFQYSGGRSINYIQDDRNSNLYQQIALTYSARYNVTEKFLMILRPNVSRNISKSSLRPDLKNNYWSYGGHGFVWVQLPAKFEFETEATGDLRQKTSAFDQNTKIIVWNARLTKKFLKDKSFQINLYAYDILNQNIGFSRTINSNIISEQRYDRVSQYFMLSAVWTFNKMPGGAK